MQRLTRIAALVAALAVVAVLALAAAAPADSPHFIRASASGPNATGQLVVSWKEAGLGNNVLIEYVAAAANSTATYACINGGERHPQATNKESFSGPVTARGTFESGKNGSISESLTLDPPGPEGFTCPPGQRRVLADVSYSGVSITDATNGLRASISGTFSRVYFAL